MGDDLPVGFMLEIENKKETDEVLEFLNRLDEDQEEVFFAFLQCEGRNYFE